jgi:hypothetical protein
MDGGPVLHCFGTEPFSNSTDVERFAFTDPEEFGSMLKSPSKHFTGAWGSADVRGRLY